MAKKWYSVTVFSNFEKKVAEQIRAAVEQDGLQDEIEEVLVPTEEVIEIKRGKQITREQRFMPGYILVRMEMSDRGYNLINGVRRVTGFLGSGGVPTPLADGEIDAIQRRGAQGGQKPRALITYEAGEKVSVNEGPFEGFSGLVEEVDEENARLKVSVSIFGRATPVELEYTQVSKHG